MQELRRAGRIERTGSLEAARWILSPVPKGFTKTPLHSRPLANNLVKLASRAQPPNTSPHQSGPIARPDPPN